MAHGITPYLLAVRITCRSRGKSSGDDPSFGSPVTFILSVSSGIWENQPLSCEGLSPDVDFEASSHRTGEGLGDLP